MEVNNWNGTIKNRTEQNRIKQIREKRRGVGVIEKL
jgi:hypothetical protein